MAADNKNKLVLVTGGTGFISSHTVKAFLDNGYRVRTTARSPENREKCKALYTLQASLDDPSRLEIVKAADLLEPECWKEAAKGCDLCAHLASPFFIARNKKDEIQMCAAAEQGTLNVLRACEEAGIKRVVVTSSMAAVLPGHTGLAGTTIDKPEEMWAVEAKVDGYTLSKLRAERAVWRYVKEENKNGMEVSTINPCWVVGPPLSGNNATSHELLAQMFARKLPAIPALVMNGVDVRDVALAHVRALEREGAPGKRFCAVSDPVYARALADELVKEFGPLGYKFTTKKLPKWVLSIGSWFNKQYKAVLAQVGVEPTIINTAQAENILGVKFRPVAYGSLLEQAHALIQLGASDFPKTPEYEEYLRNKNGEGGGAAKEAEDKTADQAEAKEE